VKLVQQGSRAAGTNGSNGLKTTTGYLYYQLSQLNAPTPSASTYTFIIWIYRFIC
jgi:hypothetical protein